MQFQGDVKTVQMNSFFKRLPLFLKSFPVLKGFPGFSSFWNLLRFGMFGVLQHESMHCSLFACGSSVRQLCREFLGRVRHDNNGVTGPTEP